MPHLVIAAIAAPDRPGPDWKNEASASSAVTRLLTRIE
jgi:hypothetical protein